MEEGFGFTRRFIEERGIELEHILYIAIGLLIGSLTAWFLARSRLKGTHIKQAADLQASYAHQVTELEKRASGAEARIEELRQQIQQKDSEAGQLRNKLDSEREIKAKLEESQKYLKEERQRLETM